ncbi:carboxymuconolactone decarboxylase family protein [Janibacter alittae]|uniref:Carboxymuconolactone decarboxylase family protein n=1 Tax=Janibacter alittae TaxID=3115209 RepID=A0ABZ2MEF1_9MICO
MDYAEQLRHLALDNLDAVTPLGTLDAKTGSLVRLGALVTVLAGVPSIRVEIDAAVGAGATEAEIVGVLDALLPVVGRPRVVAAAPKVALALGYDVDTFQLPG